MAEEKKVVKGGFRATLALIIAIIALIISIAAYSNRNNTGEKDLYAGIEKLQENLDSMKKESSAQIDKLREQTADMLEKLKEVVEKKNQ